MLRSLGYENIGGACEVVYMAGWGLTGMDASELTGAEGGAVWACLGEEVHAGEVGRLYLTR